MPSERQLLIVGNDDPIHIGAHLMNAAKAGGISAKLFDSKLAFDSSWPIMKVNWWLRGHRPTHLRSFTDQIVASCREVRPRWLLTTGISPIEPRGLEQIGDLGVARLNFLTDDPWNPVHKTSWFMETLPIYDHVFTPRQANISDLSELGCRRVSHLQFAYAPELHFPESTQSDDEGKVFSSDVVFAGGADEERLPYIEALIDSSFRVALYGGYWLRFKSAASHSRGHADPATLRKAISEAKVALCLVRRANRDGHVMRSFELPAMGACMLVEDTEEHREIFGKDSEAVAYFRSILEMVEKTRWLIEHERERNRLALAAHNLIVNGRNTYRDRLISILDLSEASVEIGSQPALAVSV
jgi:spore maturation protein CgeB